VQFDHDAESNNVDQESTLAEHGCMRCHRGQGIADRYIAIYYARLVQACLKCVSAKEA